MSDVTIRTRPLLDWPGKLRTDDERVQARFSTSWTDTMTLLEREASMLDAREIVLQLAITDAEIRLDGWPYERARPKHPGVTVVLPDSAQGRVSWSTDRYSGARYYVPGRSWSTLKGWQCNARAIALSMEALRAADRHGVMQGRQYAGFRELPTGNMKHDTGTMTVEDAARFLADNAYLNWPDEPDRPDRPWGAQAKGWAPILHDAAERKAAYRMAAQRLHPDRGGSPVEWERLQQAVKVLDEFGGSR